MYRNVDLHLLACFDSLMAERQVTRAASRMEMSQPAMSHALKRLRALFADPLLVRTPKGMVPTRRALELAEAVRTSLRHIDDALAMGLPFFPKEADHEIRIMTTDYAAETLMPDLLATLSQDAPNLRIAIRPISPSRIREELESGDSHLAIGYFKGLSKDLYLSRLSTEPIVCVSREAHPVAGKTFGLAEYVQLRHARFAGFSHGEMSTIERTTDAALAEMGQQRSVMFQIGNILVMLPVVAKTDLIATIPLGAAQRGAEQYRLRIMPLPFEVPELETSLIWHERTHRDKAHQWFRGAVRDIAKRQRFTVGVASKGG